MQNVGLLCVCIANEDAETGWKNAPYCWELFSVSIYFDCRLRHGTWWQTKSHLRHALSGVNWKCLLSLRAHGATDAKQWTLKTAPPCNLFISISVRCSKNLWLFVWYKKMEPSWISVNGHGARTHFHLDAFKMIISDSFLAGKYKIISRTWAHCFTQTKEEQFVHLQGVKWSQTTGALQSSKRAAAGI